MHDACLCIQASSCMQHSHYAQSPSLHSSIKLLATFTMCTKPIFAFKHQVTCNIHAMCKARRRIQAPGWEDAQAPLPNVLWTARHRLLFANTPNRYIAPHVCTWTPVRESMCRNATAACQSMQNHVIHLCAKGFVHGILPLRVAYTQSVCSVACTAHMLSGMNNARNMARKNMPAA